VTVNLPTGRTRTTWHIPHLWAGRVNDGAERVRAGYGNAICSLTPDGQHLPVVDLDVPARLEPSGTPGHSHLYLDVPMTWAQYSTLLHALCAAGVVQLPHFVRAVDCGATFVSPGAGRKPHRRAAARYAASYAVLVMRAGCRELRRRWAAAPAPDADAQARLDALLDERAQLAVEGWR
jgi:hypothetical protein